MAAAAGYLSQGAGGHGADYVANWSAVTSSSEKAQIILVYDLKGN